ncbi:MAG: pyrroline-5-carboxylate reductase [bacterium]|jgi:pyrroline-5-carboxylate reductase|nr:pyrroline-5-carboxylate reductase [Planctomycetota bacterium]HIL51714.1 pyrroline-5-carboxylate reductase [Planctomycetota bacterium]
MSALNKTQLGIIGLGTMGRALAQGLLERGGLDPTGLSGTVRNQASLERLGELPYAVSCDNAATARASEAVLLCVKPAHVVEVVAKLATEGALDHKPLLVSIAAGVGTAAIESAAGAGARVVRAMPNTPCLVGCGMSVVSPGSGVQVGDIELAEALIAPLGRVLRLDESHMDAVTGLSASGPAFIYVIIEALSEGGVMVGLPRKVALELAAQTVLGAATMVLETGRHPAALKDEVTTPAGCTISALMALEDGKLRSVLARGVQEAARAAGELG